MRTVLLTAALSLALLGCRKEPDPSEVDVDGDGATADIDCDDLDPERFPSNSEVCDEIDNDCDEDVDEDAIDATAWYADGDNDGWGDESTEVYSCAEPSGHVTWSGDCDDASARHHPGAPEEDCADPEDYNCDGSVGYADEDGDGWAACEECDDSAGSVNPDADEVCNDVDDDCDGDVDEAAVDAPTWYLDADEDGYGRPTVTLDECDQPDGYVPNADDCDDLHAASFPGGTEVCDEHDNDCDGTVDEDDATDASTWYSDLDGDGYGDPDTTTVACDPPSGYLEDATDCDPDDGDVYPGATETCNEVDDDCDGTVDEDDAVDASTWYADLDGDGYGGDRFSATACEAPSGYVADSSDCDDLWDSAYPGGTEVCDDHDNDCDGTIDESDATDASTWYADADGDGYGDPDTSTVACDEPSGYLDDDTDCDDTEALSNPGEDEVCDSLDNDCDGTVDEDDALDAETWYADADGDGYGDAGSTTLACDEPSGYTDDDTDCDDAEAAANPGETEVVDGVDNDCDGEGYHGDYAPTSSTTLAGGEWEFTTFEVASGVTITVTGSDPLEVWAFDHAVVDGTIDLYGGDGQSSYYFYTTRYGGSGGGGGGGDGGNGGYYTSSARAPSGSGSAGGQGGYGYSAGSGGGGGGQAAAGSDGEPAGGCYTYIAGGTGGSSVSSISTPTLEPGSGGGGGGYATGYNSNGGAGGGGGGAFYLESESIDITGTVTCYGGDGGGNSTYCWHAAGGGGGSGGTLWFAADDLSVSGTLECDGGTGGAWYACGHCGTAGEGGDGSDGVIWLDGASTLSITGTVSPTYYVP